MMKKKLISFPWFSLKEKITSVENKILKKHFDIQIFQIIEKNADKNWIKKYDKYN